MSEPGEGLPVRGIAARFAEAVFHRDYNDVDVYVEDTAEGYRKIFSNLLGRSFGGGGLALERVFPLGGRSEVVAAAREDAGQPGSKSIFIVDGDLYLLAGEMDVLPANVMVLPSYCIENLLADKYAIYRLMFEEASEMSFSQIESDFGYSGWYEASIGPLTELFLWFAVSHKLGSGIPTVSRSHGSICLNGRGDVDPGKSAAIVSEIRQDLLARYGDSAVQDCLQLVNRSVDRSACFMSRYVSAKDFTLPLLICRMRTVTKSKATSTSIKIRLSLICSVDSLAPIAQRAIDLSS